jgi:hypothetical protein
VGQAARSVSRELVEEAAETGGRAAARDGLARASRWWSVRLAGGTYAVLRRLPEAVGKLSLAELTRLGRPFCAKAGLRLSTWAPVRFLVRGEPVLHALPAGRGVKYLAAQTLQVGVGVIAIQKMEEHLASRRP